MDNADLRPAPDEVISLRIQQQQQQHIERKRTLWIHTNTEGRRGRRMKNFCNETETERESQGEWETERWRMDRLRNTNGLKSLAGGCTPHTRSHT